MKTSLILFLSLALCAAATATDIVPNPTAPGNLGQPTNNFPNAYISNAVVKTVTFGDGTTQTTAGGGGSTNSPTFQQATNIALAQAQAVVATNAPAYAAQAGTTTNLSGAATAQVTALALAQAQAVVATNVATGGSGTATNLTGAATNQVNALALAQAQAVAATNTATGGSGTATNLTGTATNQVNALALAQAQAVVTTNVATGNGAGLTNLNAGQLTGSTYLSALQPNATFYPDIRWLNTIEQSQTGLVRICFLGDSFTQGGGSTGGTNSFVKQLTALVPYSAGVGYVQQSDSTMIAQNGTGWSVSNIGGWGGYGCPAWAYMNFGGTGGESITGYGTNMILYANNYAGTNCMIIVGIDGATTNNLIINTPSPVWTNFPINLGTLGAHTVTVVMSNNAVCLFGGVEFQSKGAGVIFDNYGISGCKAYYYAGNESTNWLNCVKPNAFTTWLGLNDWAFSNALTGSFGLAMTNLQTTISNYGPVVYFTMPYAYLQDTNPVPMSTYSSLIKAVAANGGYPVIDMSYLWSTNFTVNSNLGLITASGNFHPSDNGYRTIAAYLRNTFLGDGSGLPTTTYTGSFTGNGAGLTNAPPPSKHDNQHLR